MVYTVAANCFRACKMIPKRMNFFWVGRMSWLRYLTIETFTRMNPDWEVRLYEPTIPPRQKRWTSKADDDGEYKGQDWITELPGSIQRRTWVPPQPLPAAQMSDVFQWDLLATNGGFYSDLDIVWVKPLNTSYDHQADCVFCLEGNFMAIGFMASQEKCPLYKDLTKFLSYKLSNIAYNYQELGVTLLMRFTRTKRGLTSGQRILRVLQGKYPQLKFNIVPTETVYPMDWKQIQNIFERVQPVHQKSYGLHWFGGSPLAKKYSYELTPENWRDRKSTLTNYLEMVL